MRLQQKYIVTSVIMLASFGVQCAPAFNVGFDVDYAIPKLNKKDDIIKQHFNDNTERLVFKRNGVGGSVFVGASFFPETAVEVGYQVVARIQQTHVGDGKLMNLRGSIFYGELVGYLPLNKFSLLGNLGVGYVNTKLEKQNVDCQFKQNKFGFRIGLGMQYTVSSKVGVRASLAHQKVGNKYIKNINTIKAGMSIAL